MPELPEVETIRRELHPELTGRRIDGARLFHEDLVLGPESAGELCAAVVGRRIGGVSRRAKYLLFDLADPEPDGGRPAVILRVQLRMTGRFWLGAGAPDPTEFRHAGARFALDDGRTLHYDDVRRLGGFELLTPDAWRRLEAELGPEPLDGAFTGASLLAALGESRTPIKNALLDQRRIAGLGNIYASETLFRAGIDPRRSARSLAAEEAERLVREIRAVLREALAASGTTFRDYQAINGRSGKYQTRLRVYGRDGEPCTGCDEPVERAVQAGRSTFFCPRCQG